MNTVLIVLGTLFLMFCFSVLFGKMAHFGMGEEDDEG